MPAYFAPLMYPVSNSQKICRTGPIAEIMGPGWRDALVLPPSPDGITVDIIAIATHSSNLAVVERATPCIRKNWPIAKPPRRARAYPEARGRRPRG